MNHSRAMWSWYTHFRGVPGVGSYVNNMGLRVKIGQWIEYVCSIKSENINLDRRVDLRCDLSSFLNEEILGWILRVSLEYASCASGYDMSTQYCLARLCIPGWLEIYCTEFVSGESRSWDRFSSAINWKLFNIDDWVNIPNFFVTPVSGAPEIEKQQWIGIKLGSSGRLEITDLVCIFRNHNSTDTRWWWWAVTAARQILTQRNIQQRGILVGPPLNWRTCLSSHTGSYKWGYDSVYPISVYHLHHLIRHYNRLTWNRIEL